MVFKKKLHNSYKVVMSLTLSIKVVLTYENWRVKKFKHDLIMQKYLNLSNGVHPIAYDTLNVCAELLKCTSTELQTSYCGAFQWNISLFQDFLVLKFSNPT